MWCVVCMHGRWDARCPYPKWEREQTETGRGIARHHTAFLIRFLTSVAAMCTRVCACTRDDTSKNMSANQNRTVRLREESEICARNIKMIDWWWNDETPPGLITSRSEIIFTWKNQKHLRCADIAVVAVTIKMNKKLMRNRDVEVDEKKRSRKICETGMSFDKFHVPAGSRKCLCWMVLKLWDMLCVSSCRINRCSNQPPSSIAINTTLWMTGSRASTQRRETPTSTNRSTFDERQSIFPPLSLSISYCRLALKSYPLQSCRRGS